MQNAVKNVSDYLLSIMSTMCFETEVNDNAKVCSNSVEIIKKCIIVNLMNYLII